ncbi:hypothetical protein BH09ACT4_BH09ACT4_01620 [soil metagenome]
MSPRARKVLGRLIPIVFYTALVVFLAFYLSGIDWAVLNGIDISWGFLVIATVLSLGFRYWGVGIWFFLLRRLGAGSLRGQRIALAFVYAKSWLGRYIPGAATWILGKIYFASKLGVSRSKLAVSGLLEGGLQIVATLAFAILVLLIDPRTLSLGWGFGVGMAAALLVCVIALIPPVFRRIVNRALRLARREPLPASAFPTVSTLLISVALYLGGALLAGASYFFIAAAIYPEIDAADALFVIGATSLASALSMLAVFAPGGLGVREGVLGLLLAFVVPGEIALVIVVVTRVWSFVVDGLFFAVAGITQQIAGRKNGPAEQVAGLKDARE